MTDVIAFIDALSPRELDGKLSEWYEGDMDSGTPRVTPRVMSSIYTGLSPEENGMLEVSRYGGEDTSRPQTSTLMEQAVRSGKSVLCMGMPFSIPFDVDPDLLTSGGELVTVLNGDAMQQRQTVPPQAEQFVSTMPPQSDYISDHPDHVYGSAEDATRVQYNKFKQALRVVDPDVAFIGYRLVDSYCHFQHTEERSGEPYRQHLIRVVAEMLHRIDRHVDGDVMYFSDHGQTELTDVFRVNKWLAEKGYLDYSIDYDFVDKFADVRGGETHPIDRRVENQITFNQPGVALDESDSAVVCDDPFDSCLTLLEQRGDFDAEAFRDDLLGTGMYRSVDYKWEIYDEDAEYYDVMPDVIPDRDEGVFVSGNIHKNPIGMGYYRTGVHDRTACFGATCDLNVPSGTVRPEDMYHIIRDFIGLDTVESPVRKSELADMTTEELNSLTESLDELGVDV